MLTAVDPRHVNSLFDLQVTHGRLADLGPTGLAVLDTTASDNNLKLGSKVAVQFPSTGEHEFTVQAIYKQTGFAPWVTSLEAFEANYPDQFDSQIYLKVQGRRDPGEHGRDQAGAQAVSGP